MKTDIAYFLSVRSVAGCYGNEEMVFFTPNEYRYHQMDDYDVSIAGQTSLKFQVRACNDVYVLLMATRDDFLSDVYEIVIGKCSIADIL